MTLDDFFSGHDDSRKLFDRVHAIVSTLGSFDIRVTRSQVAFRRRKNFAFTWMPDMYLGRGEVPLVLTIGLRRKDTSPRWKQVVEPYPGRFTHHLELHAVEDIDDQVFGWLSEAWELAV